MGEGGGGRGGVLRGLEGRKGRILDWRSEYPVEREEEHVADQIGRSGVCVLP